MKKIFYFILLLLISHITFAQYQFESGARQSGMAASGVVISDVWSGTNNQAGLADIDNLAVGLFYSNMFNIPDLRDMAFSVAYPTEKYGSAGLNYSYSGSTASNFSKFGLAYAKRLGRRITAGIQIDYLRFAQLNYGNSGAAIGEVGFVAEPIDKLYIGAHVFNPWRAKLSGTDEYLSSIIRIGAGYYFSEKVLVTAETEKEIDKPIVFRAGTEYNIISGLFLRGGVAVNPVKYSFGLGYNYKGITADVAYVSHQVLGYYFQFGLGYTLDKKREASEDKQINEIQIQ